MNRWIFDTHSHYDDEAFDQDRHELLGSLRDKGVGQLVNVGADMASSKEALALAKQYDAALHILSEHRLDVWTHNKAIQKARESYRITDAQKAYLSTLKR